MLRIVAVTFIFVSLIGGFCYAEPFAARIFENCNHATCAEYAPARELAIVVNTPPDEEQLRADCPQTLRFVDCSIEEMRRCTGYDIAGLVSSENETLSKVGNLVLNLATFVRDVCNVNTTLHQNYVENVDCFNGVIKPGYESCREEAGVVYNAYSASRRTFDEKDDHSSDDSECLKSAYSLACLSIQLQQNCGAIARTTFLEFIRRLRSVEIGYDCTEDEILEMKTEFLDYVKFDQEERNYFIAIFDAFSK